MATCSDISEDKLRAIMRNCKKCPLCQEFCLEDFAVINCEADHRLCKTCFCKFVKNPCSQCKNDNRKNQIESKKRDQNTSNNNVRCRFTPDGCKMVLPEVKIEHHEEECKFRSYRCLGDTIDIFMCNWTGNQISLLEHFEQMHKGLWCNMNYKYEGFMPISTPKHLEFFKSHNKYFIYVYKYIKAMKKAYIYIAHLGYQEEANKFCYEINFFIPDDPVRQLKFREICLSDSVPTADIVRLEKCVVLSDNIRNRYTQNGKLHFRFWIKTTDVFGQ